ncbi:MAG: hypothetical protein H6806_12345 [Planctomycetes bacterium]|nr:hypothetical protein [Planctomycetota bacterium]
MGTPAGLLVLAFEREGDRNRHTQVSRRSSSAVANVWQGQPAGAAGGSFKKAAV